MLPTFKPGQKVLFIKRRNYLHNDVVLYTIDGHEIIKRLIFYEKSYSLEGDNKSESNSYKAIDIRKVKGKLVYPQSP